jgi:hypothetical protein
MGKTSLESSKVSCESMKDIAWEIADYATPSKSWKRRVEAFAEAIGASFGRAYTLYYGTARRVDAEEYINAKEARRQFIEAKERKETEKFKARLRRTIEQLRAVDSDFYGADIARLERVVESAGVLDSTGTEGEMK